MKKVLIILHQKTSEAGNLEHKLKKRGFLLEYKCPALGDILPINLNPYSAIIILGGPMSVNDKDEFIKKEIKWIGNILKSNILILGLSFKENCSDTRNSKVFEIYHKLVNLKSNVHIYDPVIDKKYIFNKHKIKLVSYPRTRYYDGVIVAVAHSKFSKMGLNKILNFCKKNYYLYDLKNMFKK